VFCLIYVPYHQNLWPEVSRTLEVAISAWADWVGFVFFPKSPRHVTLELATDLGRIVKGRAKKVALSVDGT